jgi:hypothetical protein
MRAIDQLRALLARGIERAKSEAKLEQLERMLEARLTEVRVRRSQARAAAALREARSSS